MKIIYQTLIALTFTITLVSCTKESKKSELESQIQPFAYKIESKEDYSYAGTPRLVVRVYLETNEVPARDRMIETATLIWEKEKSEWKEFTVFMIFGEIEDFDSGGYGIAEFTPSGLKELRINDAPLRMLELKRSGVID